MANRAVTTPTFLLLDLGKVVVDWDPLRLYRTIFATEQEARQFCSEVCTLDWHTEHDRGIPMAENAEPLIERYPEYEHAIRAWRTRWLDMFNGYITGMPELVRELRAQAVEMFALTNLPAEVATATFDAHPLIKEFQDVIVSGAEGVVKPNPKIYQIALQRMGRPDPGSVLFVDDRYENVEAARKLGFQTHLFESAEDLRAHLREIRIL